MEATPVPHCEILEFVKDKMKEEGYDLQIVEFTDYVMPKLQRRMVGWTQTSFSMSPIWRNLMLKKVHT